MTETTKPTPTGRSREPVRNDARSGSATGSRHHWRRNLAVVGVLVLVLGLVLGGAWQLVLPMFSTPDPTSVTDYPGPGAGTVDVIITDSSAAGIGESLQAADVVATASAFVEAYERNPEAVQITEGSYTLPRQMTAADAVAALLDPANRTDRSLTVPAGWTVAQVFAKIAEVMGVTVPEVNAAVGEVPLPAEAGGNMEGWLFADTYTIAKDASIADVLTEMVNRTVADLDQREIPSADRSRVLIEASIVEAEVSDPALRGQVARVIANRLAGCTTSGDSFLQMNSTVAYGLGKAMIDLTLEDLESDASPYNTYVYEGLPPRPINSPSSTSIDAVLNPPAGDWCYFITVNPETGETRFTADPVEHEDNRADYRQWLAQWREQAGTGAE